MRTTYNAIRIKDHELGVANALEDEYPSAYVTSNRDGQCFLVWEGSTETMLEHLRKYQQVAAANLGERILTREKTDANA
jgi:hypothetical protein